jgi:hypothetical protein
MISIAETVTYRRRGNMITACKISKKTLQFFCGQNKTAGEKTYFEKRAFRVVQLLIRYCTFSVVCFQQK